MNLTNEQQKAVDELRQACDRLEDDNDQKATVRECSEAVIRELESAQRERDEAQAALGWVWKLLDRITRHEALTEVVRAEAYTWLLSPVLIEASKRFAPAQERDELRAKLLASEAGGAEMREALEYCGCHEHDVSFPQPHDKQHMPYGECRFCEKVTHALSSTTCGQSFLDERERHVAFAAALEKAIPFPALTEIGAGAMAWHAEHGEMNCGITLTALAAWLRQAETHYKALNEARAALNRNEP